MTVNGSKINNKLEIKLFNNDIDEYSDCSFLYDWSNPESLVFKERKMIENVL